MREREAFKQSEAQQVAKLKAEIEQQAENDLKKKQDQRDLMNKVFRENEL